MTRLPPLLALALLALGCGNSVVPEGSGGGGSGGARPSTGGAAPTTTGGAGTTTSSEASSSSGCVMQSCQALGLDCGQAPDGCGGTLDCGACSGNQTCGGGCSSAPNVCGCCPKTCADQGFECGKGPDGCGGVLDCGTCPATSCGVLTCGGGGTPNVCGGALCCPKTCVEQGFNCGVVGDGCGAAIDCGTCPSGKTCGGGGPHVCG